MFVMVLVIGLTAGIANAALLAEESFEYAPGELLDDPDGGTGLDGGTGWKSPWEIDVWTEGGDGAKIAAGSLEHPSVTSTGNHMKVVDNPGTAEHWYERELTTPLLDDGSTYWVSVVFQKTNNENSGSWCGFSVGENIWFGKGYDVGYILLGDVDLGDTDVPGTDLSSLVLKIESNPAEDADEQVYLWVNPHTDYEPSAATANANLEMPLLGDETPDGADFFAIEYGGSGVANSADFICDEIRIGTSFDDVLAEVGPENPIQIDPNESLLVYETDTTESAFRVSLNFRPVKQGDPCEGTPYEIIVLIDPNGGTGPDGDGNYGEAGSGIGQKDIVLLDGDGTKNQITLNFTATTSDGGPCGDYIAISGGVGTSCWDYPVEIKYQAIDDPCAEPPSLVEDVPISITMTSTVAEPNLNGTWDDEENPWEAGDPKWVKTAAATVWDNDQADILLSPKAIWLKEEPLTDFPFVLSREVTVGVTLQVPPLIDGDPCQPTEVEIRVVLQSEDFDENLPIMDPPLTITSEPNSLIFDADNYATPQSFKIWGNDDDVLQVMDDAGGYPDGDGDQNYQAALVFTVIDGGGDTRYEWLGLEDPEDPCSPEILVGLEKTVDIDIEDNECGAFGIRSMDITSSDPCAIDEDGNPLPDCYVDIYDLIELATQWLDCSYIQDTSCESYL
jgi:hypothetical protein